MLGKAIAIAAEAHEGQKDKSGKEYIEHPLRVMMVMSSRDEKIVAVLHDVIEDTPTNAGDLYAAGFPDHIITAVDAISKRMSENNNEYLNRVKVNELALSVKLMDIADNMSPARLANLPEKTRKRLIKQYKKSLAILTKDDIDETDAG